ncbi:MAG: uncharacterized protein QOH88_1597 [Verrucomicrobiota bacterium]|jgi:uncharacterized protein YegP (UPF0339 family)
MATAYYYIHKDTSSEWRWRFVATNSKTIAVSSESYHNLSDCEHSISLVKTEGNRAVVIGDDEYKKHKKT